VELDPGSAQVHLQLGTVLEKSGDNDAAMRSYEQAVSLNPDFAEALTGLGRIQCLQSRFDLARASFERALAVKPDWGPASLMLGTVLALQKRYDEASRPLQTAVELMPDRAEPLFMLADVYSCLGYEDLAIGLSHRAVSKSLEEVKSHTLWRMNMMAHIDPEVIHRAHLVWAKKYAAPFYPKSSRFANERDPDRRLRVGYVSGDLRNHSVSFFVEPILAHYDYSGFQVFCYDNYGNPDQVTARLQQYVDEWRVIARLSDDDVADLIRRDRIDILVDLSGQTSFHRLLTFARRAAPVQVSYLGYPATTGLETMDYRLTDRFTDPPGESEHLYVEKLVRLGGSLWCYRPPSEEPRVTVTPALARGYVTFGSFVNYTKLSPETYRMWVSVLQRVANSRLLMVTLPAGPVRDRVRDLFARGGVDPSRLDFHEFLVGEKFRELFQEVDVALDSFPCNGGTTTCETLWFGVPVVSRSGNTFVSRAGSSLLRNLGLPEMVAGSADEYVGIACALASDPERLNSLRLSMRERMRASPIMDEEGFTRNLETAYREMWRAWCASQPGE
jgi:predicted O-linked N-acetylglucosamine transferase (SPINDLY family)